MTTTTTASIAPETAAANALSVEALAAWHQERQREAEEQAQRFARAAAQARGVAAAHAAAVQELIRRLEAAQGATLAAPPAPEE